MINELENSTVRRDVRSWEWDALDDIVEEYLALDENVEDEYLREELFEDDDIDEF